MLRSAFIGVDKYQDPNIRELGGARRDAIALWALFSDTLPDIHLRLLVNEDATLENVRLAFDETLGAAGRDDTVVLSISCHGSHDHRIAVYNTLIVALSETTISMSDLASWFKASRAKAILCVLDCCFSGAAPARVLEESPVPRGMTSPFLEFSGTGRILLAASKFDEPAFEIPGDRHGLLTKALLETLETEDVSVSLTAAADRIIDRVRMEAARLGVTQTPVFHGYVEGGLTLPGLRRGNRFFDAFPEARGRRVTENILDLTAFGMPTELLTAWKQQFNDGGLNSLQLTAVNDSRVLDGESLLVIAPTTSGKTFVGEMAAARAIQEGRKAVFLFPYKALVNEKYDQFTQLYGDRLGMRVIRCSGDYQDQTGAFYRGKYDIALLTYETFLSLALRNPALLNAIGLVAVDEAQFITDPHRGIVVELLLTYLLAARERGIRPQLVALSAVIGDVNDFDSWLGTKKLISTERPVPLVEGVLDRDGRLQTIDTADRPKIEQLLPPREVVQRRAKPSSQDVIVPLVTHLLRGNPDERVIIFRNQRGSAQGCAAYLARDLGLVPAKRAIDSLPVGDPSVSSNNLRQCLEGGTAFHTSNLSREERVVIEREYRSRDGNIRVLAATTTVAAGINTPASVVILAEQEFLGEDGRPFTIAEYKNMAGRAGRLGYKEEGRSIILADNSNQRDFLYNKYVLGKPESLRSSFIPAHIETWILRLLAQVQRLDRNDVVRLLANTYGGYLATKTNLRWRSEIELSVPKVIDEMIDVGFLETEDQFIRLTLLGQACGRSSLSFHSAIRLVKTLKGWQGPMNAEDLLVIIQSLQESDDIYTPVMKRGQAESRWPREATQRFGGGLIRFLQRFAADQWAYFARCKRAMVIRAYIDGVPMQVIELDATTNAYQGQITAGTVRQFADAARFHLSSAFSIVTLLLLENAPPEKDVESLLTRLEVGIPLGALGLVALPIFLTRGEYLDLYSAGICSVSDLWNLPVESLQKLLTPTRLSQLNSIRPRPIADGA